MTECYVCKEPIVWFEKIIEAKINGEFIVVHNRPGCRDVWNDIKDSPNRCVICKKECHNLDFINGYYFIVCEGRCTDKLKDKLGEQGK